MVNSLVLDEALSIPTIIEDFSNVDKNLNLLKIFLNGELVSE